MRLFNSIRKRQRTDRTPRGWRVIGSATDLRQVLECGQSSAAFSPLHHATQRAFTLIELIVVMTLLVAVISIALPSLGGFFRGRTLDSEARRMLALTRQGQSRAVAEG